MPFYDAILSGVIGNSIMCDLDIFSTYTQLLKSGGQLIVKTEPESEEKFKKHLKICGLINVTNKTSGIVIGNKHSYQVKLLLMQFMLCIKYDIYLFCSLGWL